MFVYTEDNTFQRFRECNLKGFQVMRVNEWIEHNGEDVLFLDQSTDAWATLHPQAMPLKQELDRERQRTVRDMMRFQQACAELAKILRRTEATSGGGKGGSSYVAGACPNHVLFLSSLLLSLSSYTQVIQGKLRLLIPYQDIDIHRLTFHRLT